MEVRLTPRDLDGAPKHVLEWLVSSMTNVKPLAAPETLVPAPPAAPVAPAAETVKAAPATPAPAEPVASAAATVATEADAMALAMNLLQAADGESGLLGILNDLGLKRVKGCPEDKLGALVAKLKEVTS